KRCEAELRLRMLRLLQDRSAVPALRFPNVDTSVLLAETPHLAMPEKPSSTERIACRASRQLAHTPVAGFLCIDPFRLRTALCPTQKAYPGYYVDTKNLIAAIEKELRITRQRKAKAS